ncbi:RteC domain-containing protein [Arenibacter sp. GZD96]|uniref:RteC domain-containing protein n=1 Tax=Aurantibrevibacter litoralis TaxID=3106030 RepID=UPI002AFE461C|nr:RteC domain-containing protein [Arenibacter sp. GZD-96]MEA1786114.1 RteC domain-containing protein [Arenibacter sp. GZD-96]
MAKFHAIRKLLPHLQQQLAHLDENSKAQGNSHLRWTSTKAAMTELIYALHYARAINDGNSDIQEIALTLQQLFHFELGDFYKTFNDIKARKKSRTKFLDELSMGLITQLDKEDR